MTGRAAARAPAQRSREEAIAAGPRPYRQEAVGFADADANIRLADTLGIPEGAGPFPAAVLISGSGPQTRDEEVFGHKVFLVLADALNRRGIAVLRYDKRGTGASSGDDATATFTDVAADAESAGGEDRTGVWRFRGRHRAARGLCRQALGRLGRRHGQRVRAGDHQETIVDWIVAPCARPNVAGWSYDPRIPFRQDPAP